MMAGSGDALSAGAGVAGGRAELHALLTQQLLNTRQHPIKARHRASPGGCTSLKGRECRTERDREREDGEEESREVTLCG